jgi:hypothetical protein
VGRFVISAQILHPLCGKVRTALRHGAPVIGADLNWCDGGAIQRRAALPSDIKTPCRRQKGDAAAFDFSDSHRPVTLKSRCAIFGLC